MSEISLSDGITNQRELQTILPIPRHYLHRRLCDVLPALSASLGHPIPTKMVSDPQAAQRELKLPNASHIVVAVIDGLGYWNLADRAGHAPYLRSLLGDDTWIRTCYPTTTVAALATFATGTCPGLTGLLGYTQLNPQTHAIAQMIQWVGALPPEDLQREETVFTRLADQDVRVDSVSLPQFRDSQLTRAALAGPRFLKGRKPAQRLNLAIESTFEPGLTYFYLRDVDHAGHNHGWQSDEWAQALEDVDSQLCTLHEKAAPGTLLVVVADHGMVFADPDERIDIAQSDVLTRGVQSIGGEPRALMVYAKVGEDVDELAERWKSELGERAHVFTKNEAISAGLFGHVSPRIRPMIGDLIVMANGQTTLVDSRTQSEGAMSMPGVHGSWTEQESRIPLLIDLS